MKYQKEVYRSLTMIMQFGINMLVPIFMCTFLGIFLDKLLHTSFLVIILFFMGALAGFRNIYIYVTKETKRSHPLGTDAQEQVRKKLEEKDS